MLELIRTAPMHAGESIALEEILFQELERTGRRETLTCWESARPAVIVGAMSAISREVDEEACAAENVPIIRRLSGGGAVVIGPGCLNYSLMLSMENRPELYGVARSYELILGGIVRELGKPDAAIRGASDLALGDRKMSGNSQRRGRRALLHHGTVLYDFDVRLMERYLKAPLREPAYRSGRNHRAFVTNARWSRDYIEQAIARACAEIG